MKIERVEIWTDVKCNSGTHEGNIPRNDLLEATLDQDLNGKSELNLTIDQNSAAWAEIDNERVFRVIYENGDIDEFRIKRPVQYRTTQGAEKATVKAISIFMDLANGIVSRDEADGTVTTYYTLLSLTRDDLADIMVAKAPSYFSVSVVDGATTKVKSFTFNFDTPLKALQELAAMENLELEVSRNGDTDYKVNLRNQIGSLASQPEFRYRKNLNGVKRESDSSKIANRIYPAGADDGAVRLSIGEATWEVASVGIYTVTLYGEPIFEDDQFNGGSFYLENVNDGTFWQINDTDESTNTIYTTSAHDIVAGDIVKFRADGAGKQLPYVESPSSIATYGLKVAVIEEPDIPSVDNLVVNPDISEFTGSVPDNWSAVADGTAPTLSKNTSALYTKVGGSSVRVQCNSIGDGIKSDAITIAPSNPNVYFSAHVSIFVDTGSVEFYLEHSTEGIFPLAGDEKRAITTENDKFIDLIIEGKEWPAGTVRLYVLGLTATTDFYLDAAQLINYNKNLPFFEGNGPRKLWQRGTEELGNRYQPVISYTINVTDLYAIDSTKWPYDEITLGGDVLVEDEDFNLQVETRLIALKRNLLTAHPINLTLSNKPRDLVDILTGRSRRIRQESPVRPSIAGISAFSATHTNDGSVILQVWGNQGCKSFKYIADVVGNMPTVAEVIASTNESDTVDGSEVTITTLRGASVTKLAKGMRALVRVVAYPIISAEGVPGATAVDICGPPSFWSCVIDETHVRQTGNGDTGTVRVYRSFTVTDKRTNGIRIYRKEGAWPTLDNTQGGSPDPACERGVITAVDNWEYVDGGYSTSDSVRDVAIPIDNQGAEGERFDCSAYTVLVGEGSGGGGNDPRIASVWSANQDKGSNCTDDKRDERVNWTVDLDGGDETDYQIRVYYKVNDGPENYLGAQGSPETNTYMDKTALECYWGGSDYYIVDFIVELWDVSGTPVQIDSKTASDPQTGAVWEICSE